jgi:hypothetical protein
LQRKTPENITIIVCIDLGRHIASAIAHLDVSKGMIPAGFDAADVVFLVCAISPPES